MPDQSYPKPEEIQKEFESFLKNRFDGGVNIFTSQMNKQDENAADEDDQENRDADRAWSLEFDYKPKDIKDYLDRFVIQQEDAKIALSIAVCDHYNHAKKEIEDGASIDYDYAKQNVMILGPTGVGKTYLIRKIADLIGVPFVKADATRFSETGYVGANADDLIRDLVQQADGDIEKAQYGIVYLDEADKLASPKNSSGRDVSGRGVQFSLLRLMEESEVDLKAGNDIQSQIQALMDMQKKRSSRVNTKNILFIVSGAFSGLDEIIEKRLNQQPIGFHGSQQQIHASSWFQHVSTQDFIDYGFEPEFVGRLPVRVACDHLDKSDLLHILSDSEGSILKQYKASFDAYGIEIDFTEDALDEIAAKALEENTGARALMTVCESIMRKFKFELPSSRLKKLTIDRQAVLEPEKVLEELMSQKVEIQIELQEILVKFQQRMQQEDAIQVNLDAFDWVKAASIWADRGDPWLSSIETNLDLLAHGLRLAHTNLGQKEYAVDLEAAENPEAFVQSLLQKQSANSQSAESEPTSADEAR